MRLTNHIALRFLTDDSIVFEIIETHLGGEVVNAFPKHLYKKALEEAGNPKTKAVWNLLSRYDQKTYLVTDTVHDKLDMLKVKTDAEGHYDWTVFKDVKPCKKTFILKPDKFWDGGGCLRLSIKDNFIEFCHIHHKFDPGSKNEGKLGWTMFFIDRYTNRHAEHYSHKDVQDIAEFIYKLLCFIFLSDNEYEEVGAGRSVGTRKNGKFKNDLPIPVTIINSKWNVTVVRTEGFAVSGHFALRRIGVGRTSTRMVFIEPYEKHGYIRKAQSQSVH